MKYLTVKEMSVNWNLSERSIRNYAQKGRITGAKIVGGEWQIPDTASAPKRLNEKKNKNYLLEALRQEKKVLRKGGIYHRLQVDLTYNSNHIEGNELSHDETRYIFETRTIGLLASEKTIKVDDIIETINHFECVDRVIDFANYPLSEAFIKELHKILKTGTGDSRLPFFAVGDYKKRANAVGDVMTTPPREVAGAMNKLLISYNKKNNHTFDEILEFHVNFEKIHPFQDGNGRVGRLVTFKECLKNNIVPFIITDKIKFFYYRGLNEWENERGYLRETCLNGQDIVAAYLDYFQIKHN